MAPDVHHKLSLPAQLAILAVAAVGASLALPPSTAQAAGATTYYVSPAGSDSNNGTSPGSAIQSLGRASGLQLNPGDQVLLQRGATFSGKLAVWRSGTAGAPITIGAYGSGSKPRRDRRLPRGRRLLRHDDRPHRRELHHQRHLEPTAPATSITNVEATHNIHGIDVGEHATEHQGRPQLPAPQRPDGSQHPRRVRRLRRRRRGGPGRQHRGRLQHHHRQLGGVRRLRHRRLGGRDLRRHRHPGAPQHGQQQPDLHRAGQQPLGQHDLRLQPGHLEPAGHRVPDHPRRRRLLRPGPRHGRREQLGQAHRLELPRLLLLRRLHARPTSCSTTTCSTSPAGSATSRAR